MHVLFVTYKNLFDGQFLAGRDNLADLAKMLGISSTSNLIILHYIS